MARALRIQIADGTYHLNAHAVAAQRLFPHAEDCERFLSLLERTIATHEWECHVYCLMTTHYHLLVRTPEPNLAEGMKWLNGTYAQGFNRRHGTRGHVFESRYYDELVKLESHYLESVRYIVLNPVRAGICSDPVEWTWSSYRAWLGLAPRPRFLAVEPLLAQFGTDRHDALDQLRRFVSDGL